MLHYILGSRRSAVTVLSLIALAAVACGVDEAPDAPPALPTATPTVSPFPTAAETVSPFPTAAETASPFPTATLTRDIATAPTGVVALGKTQFAHNGFRTQVTRTFEVGAETADRTGAGQTLTIALRNLSPASGSSQTRATINFGSGFDNYLTLSTAQGPLVLHLHRDGTLSEAADDRGFT